MVWLYNHIRSRCSLVAPRGIAYNSRCLRFILYHSLLKKNPSFTGTSVPTEYKMILLKIELKMFCHLLQIPFKTVVFCAERREFGVKFLMEHDEAVNVGHEFALDFSETHFNMFFESHLQRRQLALHSHLQRRQLALCRGVILNKGNRL